MSGTLERCVCGGWYAIQQYPGATQLLPVQEPDRTRPERRECTRCGMVAECRLVYGPQTRETLMYLCEGCYMARSRGQAAMDCGM